MIVDDAVTTDSESGDDPLRIFSDTAVFALRDAQLCHCCTAVPAIFVAVEFAVAEGAAAAFLIAQFEQLVAFAACLASDQNRRKGDLHFQCKLRGLTTSADSSQYKYVPCLSLINRKTGIWNHDKARWSSLMKQNKICNDTSLPEEEDSSDADHAGEEYDLSQFDHLYGTTHYDADKSDCGVFKCVKIVAEDFGDGAEVVVYRSKYDPKTRSWGEVNMEDAIRVGDVVNCHNNKTYIAKMNAILNPEAGKVISKKGK